MNYPWVWWLTDSNLLYSQVLWVRNYERVWWRQLVSASQRQGRSRKTQSLGHGTTSGFAQSHVCGLMLTAGQYTYTGSPRMSWLASRISVGNSEPGGSSIMFLWSCLGSHMCHFCRTLLIKMITKIHVLSTGSNTDLTFWWRSVNPALQGTDWCGLLWKNPACHRPEWQEGADNVKIKGKNIPGKGPLQKNVAHIWNADKRSG